MQDYAPLGNHPPAVDVERRSDGAMILTSPYPPGALVQSTVHLFVDRAQQYADRILLAERALSIVTSSGAGGGERSGPWQYLSYGAALLQCRQVAAWLLAQGASVERPLAILSGSSRAHFVVAWGALLAGVPFVPVSLSYSTVRGAFPKLRAVLDTVQPAFIFAEDLREHQEALASSGVDLQQLHVVVNTPPDTSDYAVTQLGEILQGAPVMLEQCLPHIRHDTVARYMFTSGSTGMPKGVIHTHGMMCHMLAASAGTRESAVDIDNLPESRVLEWMPWSHVGAGAMRLTAMINSATTIFLDTGKPTPADFHKTVANLPDVWPTSYAGAPLGWSMLTDALEADAELATGFFAHLQSAGFGSAALPTTLARRLEGLMVRHGGRRVAMTTSLASTEAATVLSRYWVSDQPDVIGLPVPGATIKLVPYGDKLELRVKAGGVTRGYLNAPDKTAEAFDDEGFFKMGDAVRFADPDSPVAGLCFDGRVAEEFKLVSGTWVSAGTLRSQLVAACSPLVRDVVICGLNEAFVAVLVWPNLEQAAAIAGTDVPARIVVSAGLRKQIARGIEEHNAANPGSSKRVARFSLLAEPPQVGAFEITDKGYVNQGAVLKRRAAEVAALFAVQPSADVIVVPS